MIDIGTLKDVRRYKDRELNISSIMEAERHNSVVLLCGIPLAHTQNGTVSLGVVPYEKWRVIGAGVLCTIATTVAEDPIVHFGEYGDADDVAVVTFANTAAMVAGKYTSKDPYSVLPADVLIAATVATWTTPGTTIWNTWQTTIKEIHATQITASLTTGTYVPYVVIEVDSGGKF